MLKKNLLSLTAFFLVLAFGLATMPVLTAQVSRVFRSADSGSSWDRPNQGLPNQRILTAAVAPTTPQPTIYVGTGQGIYKRGSGGASWRPAGLSNERILALAVAPGDARTIYAGTLERGLFRSTNGGDSWTPLWRVTPSRSALAITILTNSPNTLYVSFGTGVLKSTNRGQTWSATGPMVSAAPRVVNPTVQALVSDNTGAVYAGTDGGGVFKSTNGGTTWTEMNNQLNNRHVLSLAIDPADASRIYAGTGGGDGVYKSTNGGSTWSPANQGLSHRMIGTLAMSYSTTPLLRTIYAGTRGRGMFKSTNEGATWSDINPDLLNQTVVVDALVVYRSGTNDNLYASIVDGQQRDFPVGRDPRGIATGQFNLRVDPFPDLAVANFSSHNVSVLLWEEKLLADPKDTPVGTMPEAMAVADFNGDRINDLAVGNYESSNVTILLGSVNATYTERQVLGGGFVNQPTAVVAGDFDGDNQVDLAVVNNGGTTVTIWFGNGNGTFDTSPITLSVGAAPIAAAVGDFNQDGILDLVVVNKGSNNVSVLINNGDGTFGAAQNFPVGNSPTSVAVGDFNQDDIPDLAVTNSENDTVSVLLGNGDGTFRPAGTVGVGRRPSSVAAGRFHGNGNPDDKNPYLAVANEESNSVSILLGDGTGGFDLLDNLAVGVRPKSIAIGYINSDSFDDLVVANAGTSAAPSNTISVLLGKGDGTFYPARSFTAGSQPCAVATADLNGGGHTDVAVANAASNNVSVLLWTGGTFGRARNFDVASYPTSVAVGDFDQDDVPDLAVASANGNPPPEEGAVSILFGDGKGGFVRDAKPLAVGRNPSAIAVGDFNRDKYPDLVVANTGTPAEPGNTISVLLNKGDGTFESAPTVTVGQRPSSVAVGDFDGDGILDLAVTNAGSNNVTILLGDGKGNFEPAPGSPVAVGMMPSSVAVGFFNDDPYPDLAVANEGSNNVSILLGNGDGSFRVDHTVFIPDSGARPVSIAVIDNDRQMNRYLAVVNQGSSTLSVLLRPGAATMFTRFPRSVGVFCRPAAVIAARFDFGIPALAISGQDQQVCSTSGMRTAGLDAERAGVLSVITAAVDCRPPCKIRDWGAAY